jgi:hypothetical protein
MKPSWAAPNTPITYGLWAWYDMSSASYVTIVGGKISVALDRTGAGRHATQAVAGNRPVWPGPLLNGLPTSEHTAASSQYLAMPSLAALTSGEIFIVVRINADPPVAGKTALWYNGTSGLGMTFPHTTGIIYDDFGSTTRQTVGDPASLLTTPRIYNVSSAPSDWVARLDGVTLFSTATNTVGFAAAPLLGASSGLANMLDGVIAEVLPYSRKLTDNERDYNNRYLKAKWGL